MSFDIDRCTIKKVWCGNSDEIPKLKRKQYRKVGTRHECLTSGFGAGMHSAKGEMLPYKSLQQIPYVGPKMEERFKDRHIFDTKMLISIFKTMSRSEKSTLLRSILKDSNGRLNNKAYNSVISYLYKNGVLELPDCQTITY